jgi:putative flippase GtrA
MTVVLRPGDGPGGTARAPRLRRRGRVSVRSVSSLESVAVRLRDILRGIWREAAKFGVVGALAFVIDNGGYNLLVFGLPGTAGSGPLHAEPVSASVVATGTATLLSWAGNRYWTYRSRHRERVAGELALFVVVNVVGIVITAATVFLARALHDGGTVVGDNIARITGWSLATVFRFVAYRRYVFVSGPGTLAAPGATGAAPTRSRPPARRTRAALHRHRRDLALGLPAALCCAGTVLVFSPGYMSYDTLYQLEQALGQAPLSDWHPPAMSLAWRGLIAVTGTPATMAVLQAVVLWGALWAVARCVWATTGRRGAAFAVLGVGLFPPVLTFAGVVWKDVHMAFALLVACAAALAGWRLPPERVAARRALFAVGLVFLVYAVLVRKNAVFAVLPVFVLLVLALRRRTARRGRLWVTASAALALGVLAPTVVISTVAKPVPTSQVSQIMLDDLLHVLSPQELRGAHVAPDLRRHLVSAAKSCDRIGSLSNSYWTCYGRGAHGPFTAVAHTRGIRAVWLRQMPRHPAGYAGYRLQLFTDFLFASRQPFQRGVLANDLGLHVAHPRLEAALRTYVEGTARDLPFLFDAWFWLAAAVALGVRPGRGPFRTAVRALGISSALYVVGYLPILPATDFRYVYWPVLACTLAAVLAVAGRRRISPSGAAAGTAAPPAASSSAPGDSAPGAAS